MANGIGMADELADRRVVDVGLVALLFLLLQLFRGLLRQLPQVDFAQAIAIFCSFYPLVERVPGNIQKLLLLGADRSNFECIG